MGDADAEQLAALGVTVIDMTAVTDPNDLNHSKFAESPEIVQLIGGSILAGNSLDASSGGPGPVGAALQGLANTAGSIVGGGQVLIVPGG